jgi:hypothetical protein
MSKSKLDAMTDIILSQMKAMTTVSPEEIEHERTKSEVISNLSKDLIAAAKVENEHIATTGMTYLKGGVFASEEPRLMIGIKDGEAEKTKGGLLISEFTRETVKQ